MISRTYFQETFYDLDVDIATRFAQAIREAWLTGKDFEGEKKQGFFLSKNRGFEDKLYVGNIHRIEQHLYWNDEELADDDQIVNVVVIDGPVTRDGDGCSYGSKDHRDQILYANTIPQVVGHLFILNTPGGACSARIDYEQAIADCREKGKPTVAWVDGVCCSAGQLIASLCDRTIAMNGKDTMGCIGTMCAFWGVPNGTVDRDGFRYIELVSVSSPDKNAEYREAVDGKTEKLQAELDKLGDEFRDTVRRNRPLVKEEHLTGKTFDAQDVMGVLVDEIGDYNRAVEAVFELADQKLTAARFAKEEPENLPGEEGEAEEQKDLATLNAQQKGAIAANPGAMLIIGDGHVKKSVDGMFGPEEQEIASSQNDNPMEKEEKKTAKAEMQEEVPATEQPETENETPAEIPAEETPGSEESAKEEGEAVTAGAGKIPDAPAGSEALVEQRDKEIAGLKEQLAALDGITKERNEANNLVAERDTTIETLNTIVENLRKEVAGKDALIQKLTKQTNDLKAEVKELAGKPAPMTDAASGIPTDNGTGEAPHPAKRCRVTRDMTYEEIRRATAAEKG